MSDIPKEMIPFFDGIEEIPFKNHGGCLFFAYSFWLWLKENNYPTDSFQIVQYDWSDGDRIEHNLQFISGKKKNPIASYHFTWLYDGGEFDTDGRKHGTETFLSKKVLEGLNTEYSCIVDEFCIKALNGSCWNSIFKRKSAIEVVESNLLIDLSGVIP